MEIISLDTNEGRVLGMLSLDPRTHKRKERIEENESYTEQ
jgi:hypothetical protein